jgi:nucleotide-binding universal stress UspA family protein
VEELETFVNRNAAWSGRRPGARLLHGEVEKEIRERAGEWEADLVVLGTHGRGGFERFLLGSVAADVVRLGAASVLVIPPELASEAVQTPVREVAARA